LSHKLQHCFVTAQQLVPHPRQRLGEAQAPRLGGQRACRRQERSPNSWCRLGTGRPGQHHNAADPPSCRAVGWCEHCRLTAWLESLRIVPWGGVAPAALIFVVPAFGRRHEGGDEVQGLPGHNEFRGTTGTRGAKNSQVKSSQVQNGGRLSAAFGAHRWRERSGGQISAQPAPLDSPESGHHPHLLDLDHRGAPGLQHRAFSGSLLYGNATRLQGRRRERSGACARAGVVLRACLVCRGVHAIPVSMPCVHAIQYVMLPFGPACAHPACVHAMSTRA